jgi:uncharacterized membrane protein
MKRFRDERGVVAPLVAVMLIGLLGIAALVIDGGVLFAARRDLQGLADGAARAGAMNVNVDSLRSGGQVVLEPEGAEGAARDYLQAAGFDGDIAVTADTTGVSVDLAQDRQTVLMGLLGVRTVRTEAHAVARPRSGIESPEGEP